MKKGLKYLSLFGIFSLTFMANVNAYSVSVEPKPGHQTKFGYKTQAQTISGGSCNGTSLFCIDKGKANETNFTGCSAIDVTGTAFGNVAKVAGDHDTKEYLYRVVAYNSGLASPSAKWDYSKMSIGNPSTYGFPHAVNWRYENTSASNETGSVSYNPTYNANGTANITATVNISNAGLNTSNFKTNKGVITVANNGNGQYTLNITQIPLAECEGADVVVTVNVPGITTSNKTGGIYFIDCHDTKQKYIVELGNCSIDDLTKGGDGNLQFNFSVPDPNCKCTGTTNLAPFCGENGYIKDSEEVKKCIISGKYQQYCGKSIAKNTDNNSSTSKTAISSQNSKSTNVNLANNKYCSVYCTEEINYDFPGVINAKAGQYFKLRKNGGDIDNNGANMGKPLSITGKRTCYTSEIKTTQYINDVIQAQRNVINAYNNYQREKARERSIANARTETVSCTASSCSRGKLGSTTGATGTKYIGSTEQYKSCSPNFNANGDFTGCSWSYPTVKEEWGDSFSSSGGGACAKSWDNWVQTCDKTTIPKPEIRPNADAITAALNEMYSVIETYKSCFEWKNNYCFNPIVEFEYDEAYDMKGQLEKTVHSIGEEKANYFTSVDNQYHGASTGYNLRTHNYVFADISDVSSQTSQIDLTSKYVSKEVEGRTEFKDSTKEVYTYHPYGTIFVGDNTCGNNKGNCIQLGSDGYVLPVALEHSASMYNYYLDITNIGVDGNDATCNKNTVMSDSRLMGSDCSLDAQERVDAPITHEYICRYTVEDCPECEVKCECPANDPNCYEENNVCKYVVCPECIVTCVGCLWNNGDATFAWKQVALSDIFPNSDNTKVGYNWNTDANVNPQAEKAEETIKEIEEASNKVYEKLQYSYVLTPTVMAEIRKYNEEANGNKNNSNTPKGGYNNKTLTFKDGKEGKSSFLDLDFMKRAERARNEKWTTYKDGSAWK